MDKFKLAVLKNKKAILACAVVVLVVGAGFAIKNGSKANDGLDENGEIDYSQFTQEEREHLEALQAELDWINDGGLEQDPETDIPVKDIQIDKVLGSMGGYNMKGEFIQMEIGRYDEMVENYNEIISRDLGSYESITNILIEDGYKEEEITDKLIKMKREEIKELKKDIEKEVDSFELDQEYSEMQEILDKYGIKLEDVQEEYTKAEEKADKELEEYLKEQNNADEN